MKRLFTAALSAALLLSLALPSSAAGTGRAVDWALYTDITAQINGHPLRSYNVKDVYKRQLLLGEPPLPAVPFQPLGKFQFIHGVSSCDPFLPLSYRKNVPAATPEGENLFSRDRNLFPEVENQVSGRRGHIGCVPCKML